MGNTTSSTSISGASTSTAPSGAPDSIAQCVDQDGNVNIEQYHLYSKQQDDEMDERFRNIASLLASEEDEAGPELATRERAKRSCFKKTVMVRRADDRDEMIPLTPKESAWYCTYVESPALDDRKFNNIFRRRFRMTYESFSHLLALVKEDVAFESFQRGKDAAGRPPCPIELLLLGTLRYIGRGWTFDDLEENTTISEEQHRIFFHTFIKWGSTALYDMYVASPTTAAEASLHTAEMEVAGFSGCIGSTDATHITMMRCPVRRANEHKSFKETLPARTYNITVNHRRQILHTTRGHPSRWNDKTLATFDTFITSIKKGRILSDVEFELYEKDANGNTTAVSYNGCWLLCDNGYHEWSCLMAPMKDPVTFKEVRWSKWLESMRKDVECTFGIMKGSFRLLKTGIRLHGLEAVDRLWCTCCALCTT